MGLKRNLDNLGRLTLPKGYRDELRVKEGEEVDVELKDNQLIVTNPKITTIRSRKEIEKKIEELKENNSFGYVDNSGNIKSVNNDIINVLKWVIQEEDASNS